MVPSYSFQTANLLSQPSNMPIEFRCSGCEKMLRVPDHAAGKRSRCPNCGAISNVPGEAPSQVAPSPAPGDPHANPFRDEASPGAISQGPFAPTGAPTDAPTDAKAQAATNRQALNPYQSPALTFTPVEKPQFAGKLQFTKLQFRQTFERWWAVVERQVVPCLLFSLIAIGLAIVISFVVGIVVAAAMFAMGMGFQQRNPFLQNDLTSAVTSQIVNLVIGVPLYAMLYTMGARFGLEVVRGNPSPYSASFNFLPFWGRVTVVWLLINIFTTAVYFVCFTPVFMLQGQEKPVELALTSLLAVFANTFFNIVITLLYGLSTFFIVDRNEGVMQSLGTSVRFMRGNLLIGFCALFVLMLLYVVTCLFVCGVFAGGLFAVFMTVIYLSVTGQWNSRSAFAHS